jgi:hypothetical protein
MDTPFFDRLRDVCPVELSSADVIHLRLNALDPGWDVETAKAWQPPTATLSLEHALGNGRYRTVVLTFKREFDASLFVDAMSKVLAEKDVQ